MKVHPIKDQVVVKLEVAKKQEGLIIRPDTAEEKFVTGRVVAVGSGRMTMSGALVPLDVAVGDQVRFNKSMASEVSHEGETVYVIREDALTCILR